MIPLIVIRYPTAVGMIEAKFSGFTKIQPPTSVIRTATIMLVREPFPRLLFRSWVRTDAIPPAMMVIPTAYETILSALTGHRSNRIPQMRDPIA